MPSFSNCLLSAAVVLATSTSISAADSAFDVLDFVDSLIGTANGGHVFAGATLPYGMAKAGPDSNDDNEGGFATDAREITGFSHMHDSGTGGSPSLANFPLFPQSGCKGDDVLNCYYSKVERSTEWVNDTDITRPGYFSLTLNTSIKAEMTVTEHTALYRFTFPSDNSTGLPYSPHILADLTDLPDSRQNGAIEVDPETGRIQGNATFSPSFGIGNYNLYFCTDFSGASVRATGVWVNTLAGHSPKSLKMVYDSVNSPPLPGGAWTQFFPPESNQIFARVGVSFVSNAQACANAETEIPDYDFDGVRSAAEDAWREKLNVVSVDATGVDTDLQTVFWSGLYRSMISPQNYTGENPLWESSEPYFDSYYCIWDSFRSIHPLLTMLDPLAQTEMIRSLIDIYKHEGKLPDCRMSLCKGFTQGGSNADVVLADSFLKNITLGVDWDVGYEAVVSDAEDEPENWSVEGRGGLDSWKNKHYIPTDDKDLLGTGLITRSISRTVEYAYDDFCIAEMAQAMGNTADYEKYMERSEYWQNMYKADQVSFINETDTGFVGFLQPKYYNETWGYQDPILCSPLNNFTSCYLNPAGHETYEGSCWLYTFYVPQDMSKLITTLGGPAAFTSRLSYFHTSGLNYIGDEQAFLTVFQFHYGGRPALSSQFAHYYIPSQFNTTVSGIAGNDDSGAMGSFTSLAMMGIWPIAGQNVYLIMAPFFPSVSIKNGQTGNTATIKTVGFDAGYENIFVQSATLNGAVWTKSWVTHEFFLEGGVLELVLGPMESAWGTAEEDLPPSASTST